MTLLQRAADYYAALVFEKNPFDPAVLGFRTYLVQHFQMEGMHEADRIDAAYREGSPVQPMALAPAKPAKPVKESEPAYAKGFKPEQPTAAANTGKPKYRTFEHPAQGLGKSTPGQLGKIRGRFNPPAVQPGEEAEEEQPEVSSQPASQSKPQGKRPATLPAANTGEVTQTAGKGKPAAADNLVKITPAQLEELAEAQPSAAIKTFSKEQILACLEDNKVKHNAAGSHRQLAATLINWAKKKVS